MVREALRMAVPAVHREQMHPPAVLQVAAHPPAVHPGIHPSVLIAETQRYVPQAEQVLLVRRQAQRQTVIHLMKLQRQETALSIQSCF